MSIIVSCTQVPYNGGAATNSYALIKYLRQKGFNAAGVFYVNRGENADVDEIGGIFSCHQNSRQSMERAKKDCLNYLKEEPKLVLAKNYVAPVLSRKMFPESKVVYLVSGAPNMMEFSKRGVSAEKLKSGYSRFEKINLGSAYDGIINTAERSCVNNIDYFLFNSKISKELFLLNYENIICNKHLSSPINTSVFLNNYSKTKFDNFNEREIGILFASSRLTRHVKNFELAQNIFNSNEIIRSGIKIVVVGKELKKFSSKNKNKNVKFLGYQKNSNLMKLMLKSKIVLCTSYFDASPNLISEAISCGSNILCSNNCGWSEIYNPDSVCKDVYNVKEWVSNIFKLLEKRYTYDLQVEKNESLFDQYIKEALK